jgi:hypothetical protein
MSESLFSVREITRKFPIYDDVEEALWHNAPQALLRDLHRPVLTFNVNPMELQKIELQADGGREAVAYLKGLLFADYRVPMARMVPTNEIYRQTILERRRALGGKWADAPKFGSQYLPATATFGFY